ncbi:MAG TPA: hypothetical protein VMV86_06675 [Methanosarcinales archaeon]|nr:hypothetical protein [Methanosarcinales archaeon]
MANKRKNWDNYKTLIIDIMKLHEAEPDRDPKKICEEFADMGTVNGKNVDPEILYEAVEEYL